MLAASSFAVLAASSTGSVRPWDWTRADPSAAASRYQACGQQGLGAIGCMLSAGIRPASAAGGAQKALQPALSIATIQDQAPSQAAGSKAPPARGSLSSSRPGATSQAASESKPFVKLPANASTEDVVSACQQAMKAAQPEGSAAIKEVEVECEADLASRRPSTGGDD